MSSKRARMMTYVGPALGVAAVAAIVVASPGGPCRGRDLEAVGERAPLVLLLSPAHGKRLTPEQLDELRRHLAAEAALEVEVRVAASDREAMHAVGAKRADAALLPLFGYLLAHREYGSRASLRVLRDGGADKYSGEILVRTSSGITSLQGLSGRKVAFVGPWSTSGFILPAKMLDELRAHPEVVFTGSHEASLKMLQAGKVDAAVTFAGAGASDPSLRAIASTPTVPNEPVFFRRGLSREKREQLERALLSYARTPEGKAVLKDAANMLGFARTTDAAYLEAVEVLRDHGKRIEDLVADGWKITNSNQLPLSSYAP